MKINGSKINSSKQKKIVTPRARWETGGPRGNGGPVKQRLIELDSKKAGHPLWSYSQIALGGGEKIANAGKHGKKLGQSSPLGSQNLTTL